MPVLSIGSAQTEPTSVFKVSYYSNANTAGYPDGTVRMSNVGTATTEAGDTVCAMIYVFDDTQLMVECCACQLAPDGLRTLSVNSDLTSNPINSKAQGSAPRGISPVNGVIKIISSYFTSPGYCDPRRPEPVAAIRAWATHIQGNAGSTAPSITEEQFEDAKPSANELKRLTWGCSVIILQDAGICTCGTGS
jgi:hypothetical protein